MIRFQFQQSSDPSEMIQIKLEKLTINVVDIIQRMRVGALVAATAST